MVNYAMYANIVLDLLRNSLIDPVAGIRKSFQRILYLFGLGVCWIQLATNR
jgi:hypothetical protein